MVAVCCALENVKRAVTFATVEKINYEIYLHSVRYLLEELASISH